MSADLASLTQLAIELRHALDLKRELVMQRKDLNKAIREAEVAAKDAEQRLGAAMVAANRLEHRDDEADVFAKVEAMAARVTVQTAQDVADSKVRA